MVASLNPFLSKFGETFDAEKSSQYRLTIQFALDGFSYALLDSFSNCLIALECYPSEPLSDNNGILHTLEQAMESKGLYDKSFQSVSCLIDNRICTLVPEPLFNETDQAKYLDFGFQTPKAYNTIAFDRLVTVPCFNVYAWSKNLQDKMLAKWKNTRFIHTSSIFIDSAMREKNNSVFVHVRSHDFDMLIKKDGKLFFFNNFKYNTKEDFNYFLLFAMEQNGFAGQDTPVIFSGLILPDSEIMELCKHYIKNIHFVEDSHELQICKAFDEVPFQYYYIHYQALR